MSDGKEDEARRIDPDDTRNRLIEAETVAAVLEARLAQYQAALESIRSTAAKALDS